jgi:hypothetical protein
MPAMDPVILFFIPGIAAGLACADLVDGRLRERYYDHYAMILFMQDACVPRSDEF